MGKIERNILKMIKKEEVDKAIKFTTKIIKDKSDDEKSEAIFNLGPVFAKNKELKFAFPEDLFNLIIKRRPGRNGVILTD